MLINFTLQHPRRDDVRADARLRRRRERGFHDVAVRARDFRLVKLYARQRLRGRQSLLHVIYARCIGDV